MTSKKNTKPNEPSQEDKRQTELAEFEKRYKKKQPQQSEAFESGDIQAQVTTERHFAYENRVEKKRSLQAEIENYRDQNVKKTHKIDGSLKMEEQDLIEIQTRFEQQEKKNKQELRQLTHRFAIQQQAIRSKYKKQMELKKQQLGKISQKVQHLHHYPERKVKYQSSLEELNLRLDKMKNQQEKDIKNIQNNHLKERVLQQKQTQQEMQKIKVLEVNRLEKKMTKQQYIKRQNQVMQQQIQLCQQQIVLLNKECQELKAETRAEKLQIQDNTLGGQASETYERSLRIIKLEGKMNKLRAYLGEQTTKLEKQFNQLDTIYTKQHQQVQSKISKIEGWLRIKQRDLKKVKACSQMVLNQRSNLQSYLLEVFYEHPEIDYKNPFNMNKVLRFLFVKINSKKVPMSYKNFLPVTSKTITENSFRA